MIIFKIIDVIGYSGSGKTFFITTTIKLLKEKLDFNVAVIKNVKHHPIDKIGKDSYLFRENGASYSVIQNNHLETAIFINRKGNNIRELLQWLNNGPYKIDLLLTEGFRNLHHPTVLCVSKFEDIQDQFNESINMISGIICVKGVDKEIYMNLPILDIQKNFSEFLEIFNF
ncbi:hypothetical protein LCGC14_0744210 [marine sediment metagenome]|uniref:Molybdopterin-guanine dinucleotide biosynthesis protein B (MobB) domain-containing protein n=1 Tax=marine sediment metagenome TaxID=412755 RepID=A0A0F9QQX6_9ZZZZ